MVEVNASGATTCNRNVAGEKQGHASCKLLCTNKDFFVSVTFHGDHKTVARMRRNLATLSFGDIIGFKNSGVCLHVYILISNAP